MRALILLLLGAILIAAVSGAVGAMARLGGAISAGGWFALAAGSILTLALGACLMGLVFYSARKGFDERVASDPTSPESAPEDDH